MILAGTLISANRPILTGTGILPEPGRSLYKTFFVVRFFAYLFFVFQRLSSETVKEIQSILESNQIKGDRFIN